MAYVDVGVHSEDEARAKGFERLDAVTLWPDLSIARRRQVGRPIARLESVLRRCSSALPTTSAKRSSPRKSRCPGSPRRNGSRGRAAAAPRSALGSARARRTLQPKFAVVIDGIPADRGERPGLRKGPGPRPAGRRILPKLKEAVEAAAREAKVSIQVVTGSDSTLLNGFVGEGTEAVLAGPAHEVRPDAVRNRRSQGRAGPESPASAARSIREGQMRKATYGFLLLVLMLNVAAAPRTSSRAGARRIELGPPPEDRPCPGMSGQEAKAADFLQAALPASLKVQRDPKHNVWFTVGEGKPHIMFVAHMDELGYTVDKITPQGTAMLKPYTAFLPQVSEARAFVIHTAKGPVEGIIMPPADYYVGRTAVPAGGTRGAQPATGTARGGAPAPAAGTPPAKAANPPQQAGQAAPPAQAKAAPPAAGGAAPGQGTRAAKPAGTGAPAKGATPGFEVYLGVSTEQEARALGVAEGNPCLVKKKLVDISPGSWPPAPSTTGPAAPPSSPPPCRPTGPSSTAGR